jgi:hypothetical protein
MSHAALAIASSPNVSAPPFRFLPPSSGTQTAADKVMAYAREAVAGLEVFARISGLNGNSVAGMLKAFEAMLGRLPEEIEAALGASRYVVIGDFRLLITPNGTARAAGPFTAGTAWMVEDAISADAILSATLQSIDTFSRLLALCQSAGSATAALHAVPGDAGILWKWLRNRAANLEQADLVLQVSRCGVTATLTDSQGRPLGEWTSADLAD